MNRRAIALTCDTAYLLPSLVCAEQARAHAPGVVKTVVFVADLQLPSAALTRIFEETGVEVIPAPPETYARLAATPAFQFAPTQDARSDPFRRNHLSTASLLRLALADLIDQEVGQILYLDGDMQVTASLAPLFEHPLAAGRVLAARDWNAFHATPGMPGSARELAALSQLGLTDQTALDYINTGMLLADRAAWADFGPAALAYYNAHPPSCRYYDQCALNAVLSGRVDFVSQRFNFLRFYLPLPVYRELDPAIIHYCYRPKPWDGPIAPWGKAAFAPYQTMARRLAELGIPWVRRPLWERLAHDVRARTHRPFKDQVYRDRLQALIRAG